jgi:hypothetical protein
MTIIHAHPFWCLPSSAGMRIYETPQGRRAWSSMISGKPLEVEPDPVAFQVEGICLC